MIILDDPSFVIANCSRSRNTFHPKQNSGDFNICKYHAAKSVSVAV